MLNAVGLHYVTRLVNFLCKKKPEYPKGNRVPTENQSTQRESENPEGIKEPRGNQSTQRESKYAEGIKVPQRESEYPEGTVLQLRVLINLSYYILFPQDDWVEKILTHIEKVQLRIVCTNLSLVFNLVASVIAKSFVKM